MKKIAFLICLTIGLTNALFAQVPDLSAATLGPTLKKVIAVLKSGDGYGRGLYDSVTGNRSIYFNSTVSYPKAHKTYVNAYPNVLHGGDSLNAHVVWMVQFIKMPTGTSNGFGAEMTQLISAIKEVFPKGKWPTETTVIIENGISITLGKYVNDQYKLPDDIHLSLSYDRILPLPSAGHIVRLLNQLDSTISVATTPAHGINYCASAYAHLRREGILPKELARLFTPMLNRLEDRFRGVAWPVIAKLPSDADITAIKGSLSPAALASAMAGGQKAIDDFNAKWKANEQTTAVPSAQSRQTYYKPQYMVCDYCGGKGSTNSYTPKTDYDTYGSIRVYKHSTTVNTHHCEVCRGTGMRAL